MVKNGVRSGIWNFGTMVHMARPLRVEYPGALYHVIARGNVKQNIFLEDRDRRKFLMWLEDACESHNLICHAYCLMDNHYHLLLETNDANLSVAMRDLNGNYSQWFNVIHDRVGHVLQGRYKAFVIEKETYLFEVARYIVLNPVRAGLIDRPQDWKWSSYRGTAGFIRPPEWLHIDWLLEHFSKDKHEAQLDYRKFIDEGIDGKDPYEEVSNGFLLGSPQFVSWIWEKTNGSEELKELPRKERIVGRPSLTEIFSEVMTKEGRNDAIVFARLRCGYLSTEIGRHLGLDGSTIGKICKDV